MIYSYCYSWSNSISLLLGDIAFEVLTQGALSVPRSCVADMTGTIIFHSNSWWLAKVELRFCTVSGKFTISEKALTYFLETTFPFDKYY